MKLFYRKWGKGSPFIILHGLYGASDNWMTIARELSVDFTVYALDIRNHGNSPHSDSCRYSDMVEDVVHFMDEEKIMKATILGHSMGGNIAMMLAVHFPHRIIRLIVEDMPVRPPNFDVIINENYQFHTRIVDAIYSINLSDLESRSEVDSLLKLSIPNITIRQFLLKNLRREDTGNLQWKMNITAIRSNLPTILKGLSVYDLGKDITDFPVLFLKGELSNYINGIETIQIVFPEMKLVLVKRAGHWVHSDNKKMFLESIKNFCL